MEVAHHRHEVESQRDPERRRRLSEGALAYGRENFWSWQQRIDAEVDAIEELCGRVPFEKVWGLLIDSAYEPGLPPAEPYNIPIHTGDIRVDVQAAVAMLAPAFGMRQTYDISDEQAREDLSRVAVMVLSYAAQAARGLDKPVVSQREVDKGRTLAERFMIRWKGEADPKHVKAIDAYWSSAAEHGMNASTFTARVITSTGADLVLLPENAVVGKL